jgi:hypothetical protein
MAVAQVTLNNYGALDLFWAIGERISLRQVRHLHPRLRRLQARTGSG